LKSMILDAARNRLFLYNALRYLSYRLSYLGFDLWV
jgi:hypothetical protein